MPDFDQTRAELNRSRDALAASRSALDVAREARLRVENQHLQAQRTHSDQNAEELAMLSRRLEDAVAAEGSLREEYESELKRVGELEVAFAPGADPRAGIGNWDGDTPILLFPVRLETRFHAVPAAEGGPRDELWVRIYPDDCLVDTFEEMLSETELASARRFWTETWAAGGVDGQRRTAWRNLVASHGAGRAAWIVDRHTPIGPAPVKAADDDVVLVIIATAAPDQA